MILELGAEKSKC